MRVILEDRTDAHGGASGEPRELCMQTSRQAPVMVDGIPLHPLTEAQTVDAVMAALDEGRGGILLTANTDIMRQLRMDHGADLVDASHLIVPDGMPVVWASLIQGGPRLPERVTGADLVWTLSEAAAKHGRKVFLLGAGPGVADKAAEVFQQTYPDLQVAGTNCPPTGFESDPAYMAELSQQITSSGADLVYVALGFPKQERVAMRLLADAPATWFMGCGGALDMAAGQVPRANERVQKAGGEWLHRLSQEPRRLAHRYLVLDLPYAVGLLARAARARGQALASGRSTTPGQ